MTACLLLLQLPIVIGAEDGEGHHPPRPAGKDGLHLGVGVGSLPARVEMLRESELSLSAEHQEAAAHHDQSDQQPLERKNLSQFTEKH